MSVLLRFTASHYSFGIFWSLYCLFFYALRLLITPLIYFGHCIVCPSTLYGFSLHLWYLLAIVFSILLRFTASHYSFGIFWPLHCLSFYALRLLITPLVSFGHCIVCPSTLYGFSLLLWYLLAIALSVLRFTASHYPFGIFWPLYCLSFYALRLLITPLIYFGHCIVCPSTLYGFSLHLWYLLVIVLSVLLRFTASHYPFGIFWSLYCLSFYALRLLITPLVYFGHCIVCPSTLYGFSLLLLYLLVIVLSVFLRFTASHYSFGVFWPLYCLSFYALRLLITTLVSFGHCIVCPSTLYGFSLPFWYLLAIVLSVLLRFTASHYPFGIFWPLYSLSLYALRLLITPLIYFGHCIVCPSTLYGFSLHLWYLLVIVLSVLLRFTASHYSFGIFWSLYCLSFYAFTASHYFFGIFWPLYCLSSTLLRFTASHYTFGIHCIVFGIFWPLYCLSFYDFRLLITTLVLYCLSFDALRLLITLLVSFGHCIVCPSTLFSLPFWYLLAIVMSVLLRFTASHYTFGIFWSMYCLSFYDLRLLITPLVSFGHCIVCPSTLYGLSFGHCIVCPSTLYGFSLLLWYHLVIVCPYAFTAFGIFWPLYCLSFYALRLLITPLVSFGHCLSVLLLITPLIYFGHCIVCPSTLYGFSLLLWYLLLLITPLVSLYCLSFGHCIVCPFCIRFTASHYCLSFWYLLASHYIVLSTLYGFSLPLWYLLVIVSGFSLLLWYLLVIVLSVLRRFTASHYPFGHYYFGIFWSLYSVFGHCIVCPSTLYGFSLSFWYLLAIVMSVLLRFTASHYTFGIFWSMYCLSFYDLRLLITPLVSFGHCIVCPSTLYGFSLILWYHLAIVLSVLLRFTASHYSFGIIWSLYCLSFYAFTASHYSFGIFWPLYCLSLYALRLLITPLIYFGHCIVCPSTLYGFSLLLWYLLVIVLSVLLRFTASHYSFDIFWSLYCLSFYALRLLITPLVSFGHCIVCPSTLYASHYSFGIFWPLHCLSFYVLRLLITPLVSFGHCIVCPSTLYGFSLLLWYLLAIALSVLRFTASHYPFGIFRPLYCLSFYALRLLITPLIYFGHCIVCPSTLYGFSLHLWYLLVIVLSVLLRFTASHYPFGIFWSLYCLSFYALRLLITPLVYFGHCIVCPSTLYGFSLLLLYLLVIVLSVFLRFTASHYSFGVFWPLYCLSFYALRLLITPLVSFGHCIVCPSTLYGFSLPFWYLLAIVLSVLLRFTASHYPFGIFWPLYSLSFYALRLLITPLVSFGHCIVCPSTLYGFSLLLWYLLVIVLSVLLRFYGFSLLLWYLLAIVLSVLLRFTASH